MSKKLEPKNGSLILKRIEEQEAKHGNIIIPDLGKEKPEMAIVVSISETYNWHIGTYRSSEVDVGDTVLIPKAGPMVVSVDGEDYIIAKEEHILATIKNEE